MPKINNISFTNEEITTLCEDILRSVDYDIYREDLDNDCAILAEIECAVRSFVENVEVVYE